MNIRFEKESIVPEDFVIRAKKIISKSEDEFPTRVMWDLVSETLYSWDKASTATFVVSKDVFEEEKKIGVVFCVASSDWAGMSEACVGVIHSRKFNITRLAAFVVDIPDDDKTENVGLILMYIKPEDGELRKALFEEKDSITRTLNFASWGMTGTTALVASESGKVEMMARVVQYLEEKLKDREEVKKKITAPEGEIAKFFASRSTEYLRERTTKQIGDQILINFQLVNRVRETEQGALSVENLTTNREELTCITAAAFQQNLTLDDILLRIDQSVQKAQRKFDKTFITKDGIKVIRLEISSSDGNFYVGDDLERLKKNMMKALSKLPSSNYMNFKNYLAGGQEHYSRAIIPLLVKEFGNSKTSQIYVSMVFSNEFSVHFKIVMVDSKSCITKEFEIKFIEDIEKIPGFFVTNFIPAKNYGDICVFMFDLQCDLDVFVSEEEAYKRLKEYFSETFESYRDFTEGMQNVFVSKLMEVKNYLVGYDQNLVYEIYFSIEGFHRFETPVEILAQEIKAGIDALNLAKESIQKRASVIEEIDREGKSKSDNVIVSMATKEKELLMKCAGIILRKYEVNLCKLNHEPYYVVIMNISLKNGFFPEEDKQLVERFCEGEDIKVLKLKKFDLKEN
ncbi:hypothetical protein JXA84_02540 [candidate division WOR-3 bacterium]|nr:hypothetical protein [candidate division WOR-3 bacterium]